MGYASFWKGVHFNRRLTRDRLVWERYICWWLRFNLEQLPPRLPQGFYAFLHRHSFGLAARIEWAGEATRVVVWRAGRRPEQEGRGMGLALVVVHLAYLGLRARWRRLLKPLDDVLGTHAHRCDFTDSVGGLLYGGTGETMNQLFDQFIQNIDGVPIVDAALANPEVQAAINLQPPPPKSSWGPN